MVFNIVFTNGFRLWVMFTLNDKVHQSMAVIFGNKNIHSSLNVAREKVKDLLLNMCFALQNNSCNNIVKCVVGCCTFIPIGASKQTST